MLLQFAVENFRSIADKVVLSFLAVEGEEHPKGQVVQVPGVGGVLRSLVIYGPNASGKSTLVDAFRALRRLAVDGAAPGQPLPHEPHVLRRTTRASATKCELELYIEGRRYAFGLAFSRQRIEAEWLHRIEGDRDVVLYERRAGAPIELGAGVDVEPKRRDFLAFVAEGTRPEQPFLAELRARNANEFEFLWEYLLSAFADRADMEWDEAGLAQLYLRWPGNAEDDAELLRDAGTGVLSIALVTENEEVRSRFGTTFSDEESERLTGGVHPVVRVAFRHVGPDGTEAWFSYRDLSDGTRRLLWLSEPGCDDPDMTWVDELDRSLHTQLSRFVIVRMVRQNPASQFVFTTHDTNLLDAGVFGRDAIWFCEKDSGGATHLYSLVEFDKAQLDQLTGKLEEGYLQGRFGALPFASDPVKLGWAKR